MQIFQLLNPTLVTLKHVNIRSERHGKKQRKRAIDVKVMMEGGNDLLNLLHPRLKDRFYYRNDATENQGDIEGVEKIAPNLYLPQLGEIPWPLEMTGVDVSIIYGTGDERSNFDLIESSVNQFFITMKEGGIVQLRWKISTSHVPNGALDKLSEQLEGPLEMTMVKNEKLIQQAVIDGTVGHPGLANGTEGGGDGSGDAGDGQGSEFKPKGKGKGGGKRGAKSDSEKADDATQAFIGTGGDTPPATLQ